MRIALVDTNRRASAYPVALLKLGAWRQSLGDDCRLFFNHLPPPDTFDAIWLSTVFTYDIPHALGLALAARDRAEQVRVGGISATLLPEHFERHGLDVHRGLIADAELHGPDYSLLGQAPSYSISYTSRGCVRRCQFCMVHRLEPEFVNRPNWERDLYPAADTVFFYDNNWFAKQLDDLVADICKLRSLVSVGRIKKIDFNQGLDCRLLTEEIADQLVGLPIDPVRFAFDGMHEDGHYQDAIRMMAERGFRGFTTYTLYNFMDTPRDFYYRLRVSAELGEELGMRIAAFPMRYQPILDVDGGRDYVGRHWTMTEKKGFMSILQRQSISGQVSPSSVKEFEYWFGADADEFVRLLNYPRIRELSLRKKGAMRYQRAGGSL